MIEGVCGINGWGVGCCFGWVYMCKCGKGVVIVMFSELVGMWILVGFIEGKWMDDKVYGLVLWL